MKMFIPMSVLVLETIFLNSARALDYFEAPINYWGKDSIESTPKIEAPIVQAEKAPAKEKFEWNKYLDPKNDEFFREGDYTPPKPFMEVARNPSNENLKNWFEYMRAKNELATRLQDRMQEYLGGKVTQVQPQISKPSGSGAKQVSLDPTRFKFRMYFDSHCPHCKRMFETLVKLKNDGFEIEALQIDPDPLVAGPSSIHIDRATPEEVKKHNIGGVPHLVVADLKRQALLPAIKGYQSYEEIIGFLRSVN